jgi:integrase
VSSKSRRYGRGSVSPTNGKNGRVTYRWQLTVPADPFNPTGPKIRKGKSGYSTKSEAEKELRLAMRLVEEGKSAKPTNVTVTEYALEYLSSLQLANSTLRGYSKNFRNHIEPHLGSMKMKDVVPLTIAKYYKKLQTTGRRDSKDFGGALSANTVNKIHVLIGSIFESAVRDGVITVNPFRADPTKINAPTGRAIRSQKVEIVHWNPAQFQGFFEWNKHIHNDDLYTLWKFFGETGVRRGEAVALQWDDINFDTKQVSIRRAADSARTKQVKTTKTMRDRNIMMSAELVGLLINFKTARARTFGLQFVSGSSFVFGNEYNELRNVNAVTERWRRIVMKAQKDIPGLPWVTLKGLRHTHASLLLQAGVNPKIVQERLGHTSIQTTLNIYSHVTPTVQENALSMLGDLFSKVGSQSPDAQKIAQ